MALLGALLGWLCLIVIVFTPLAKLPAQAAAAAISQLGFMELTSQPNRGPQVDTFLKSVDIKNPVSNPRA
jgi:hypothetical protein